MDIKSASQKSFSDCFRHLISNSNLANLLCESIQRQLLPQAFKGLVADVATSNNPLKQLSSSWLLVYTMVLPDFQIALCSLTVRVYTSKNLNNNFLTI